MKALIFAVVSLASISLVECSSKTIELISIETQNFKGILDWIYEFSKGYENRKQQYEQLLNETSALFHFTGQHNIGTRFSEFICKTADLRNILAKGEVSGFSVSEEIAINIPILIGSTSIIKDIVDDLRDHIREWNQPIGKMKKVTKISEKKPMVWFRKQGFHMWDIQDVSIDVLQHAIDEIFGDDKPHGIVMSYFSSCFFVQRQTPLGAQLAWLATFGSYTEAVSSLEKHLDRIDPAFPRYKKAVILENLRILGATDSALRRLIGNSVYDGLYTFNIKAAKHAKLAGLHPGIYMYVLSDICKDLEERLLAVENTMRTYYGYDALIVWNQDALITTKSAIFTRELPKKVRELITDDGPITKLCGVVRYYADAISNYTYQPSNRVPADSGE